MEWQRGELTEQRPRFGLLEGKIKGIEERNLEIKIELERETFTIGTETATSLLHPPPLRFPLRSLNESRLGNLNYAVFKVKSQGNP
jgi:hypothetical protein